jgi:hypothetical protein
MAQQSRAAAVNFLAAFGACCVPLADRLAAIRRLCNGGQNLDRWLFYNQEQA